MKGKFSYHVKQVSPVDFELRLGYKVSNRLFKQVFEGCKRKIAKGKGRAGMARVERFDIPDKYFKLLATGVSGNVKQLMKDEFERDGFKIVEWKVVGGFYEKKEGVWQVTVCVGGICEYHESKV